MDIGTVIIEKSSHGNRAPERSSKPDRWGEKLKVILSDIFRL